MLLRNTQKFPLLLVTCLVLFCGTSTVHSKTKRTDLDPETVQALSSILDSLDTFTEHRLKDLEKLRLQPKNGSTKAAPDPGGPSAVAQQIKALKDGIMSHNPSRKTFGYKVTVYTSPISPDGKTEGKPVLVTQYIGGDMKDEPEKKTKKEASEDLEESASAQQPSESIGVPVLSAAGEESSSGGGKEHSRKTEHEHTSEKGHHRALDEKVSTEKGHDRTAHRDRHKSHHKESDREAHRHDTHAHDKGGATQQGIRERTEIEYYEREHFLDTEVDKAKAGHEKTSGVKEKESHSDHDDHDLKRLHEKDSSSAAAAAEEEEAAVRPAHYSPPYGPHLKGHEENHKDTHHERNVEESKGKKGHNSERDHHSEQKDTAHEEKDKARRKEGYRERGYKITAEREYFLNDAHHDKGQGSHTSGERSRDREGLNHDSKEGERDRGFVKEEKSHQSHDAEYDAKSRRFEDGEKVEEGFVHDEKRHKEKIEERPGVVYLEEPLLHPELPIYPRPVPYAASGDQIQTLKLAPPEPEVVEYQRRRNSPLKPDLRSEDIKELEEQRKKSGYRGYASYKKKPSNPLISAIKEKVRSPPPTYAPPPPPPSKPYDENQEEETKTEEKDERIRKYSDEQENSRKYIPEPENVQKHAPQPEHLRNYLPKPENLRKYVPETENIRKYAPENENVRKYVPETENIRKYTHENENARKYVPDPENIRKYAPEQKNARKYAPEPENIRKYPTEPQNVQPYPPPPQTVRSHAPQPAPQRPPNNYQPYVPRQQPQQAIQVYPQQPVQPYPLLYPHLQPDDRRRIRDPRVYSQATIGVLYPRDPDDENLYRTVPKDSQGKPAFSPVVLLTQGPPSVNQALDVWYTRQ